MKKKIGIILVLILTFILGFVSGTYFKSNNDNIKISRKDLETSTFSNNKDTTPSPIEYKITEISMSTTDNARVGILLKNNGNDTLKNAEFYIVAWDTNGYPLKLNLGRENYSKINTNNTNILKGESKEYHWMTFSDNKEIVGQYEIVPYKAEFYDGTVWEDDKAEDKAKKLFEEVRK